MFRGDTRELLGASRNVSAVEGAVKTLAELLAGVEGWRPPDLTGVSTIAQPHCHQRSVMGFSADRALLEQAGADVQVLDGCCGLASNFEAERGHYDVSVAVADTAMLPAVRAADAATTVLTDGFSCRTQLDHLAHRDGVHLAELLAGHLGGGTNLVQPPPRPGPS